MVDHDVEARVRIQYVGFPGDCHFENGQCFQDCVTILFVRIHDWQYHVIICVGSSLEVSVFKSVNDWSSLCLLSLQLVDENFMCANESYCLLKN